VVREVVAFVGVGGEGFRDFAAGEFLDAFPELEEVGGSWWDKAFWVFGGCMAGLGEGGQKEGLEFREGGKWTKSPAEECRHGVGII
jgi:hypothetical protein